MWFFLQPNFQQSHISCTSRSRVSSQDQWCYVKVAGDDSNGKNRVWCCGLFYLCTVWDRNCDSNGKPVRRLLTAKSLLSTDATTIWRTYIPAVCNLILKKLLCWCPNESLFKISFVISEDIVLLEFPGIKLKWTLSCCKMTSFSFQ